MSYTAIEFYAFVILICFLYYTVGLLCKGRFQWCILLLGSICFYAYVIKDAASLIWLSLPIAVSYLSGLLLQRNWHLVIRRILLALSIAAVLAPLIIIKVDGTLFDLKTGIVAPVGVSFYTLQLIAYLYDCYKRKIVAQINPLKHVLFTIFFPHIIQGPIPRYEALGNQLFNYHPYNSDDFMHGIQKIIFGFFLKFMIADKAAIFVNTVFDGGDVYVGGYILIAAILYSFQLYADFYSCTLLCQGVSLTFGIRLSENFNHPYFSISIKDFWRRWHISLSTWLRDYIYIPLGGSKKGKFRKYINIIITFLISGFWHGNHLQFIVWGGIHAIYQIFGDCTNGFREKIYLKIGIKHGSDSYKIIKSIGTFFLVAFAWIFFRAKDLNTGIMLIRNMFGYYNPWTIFGTKLFSVGLNFREFDILLFSLIVLFVISFIQEKGISLHKWFQQQHLIIRWCIYIFVISSIWVMGTYGFGFNAQDFIYGGF